MENNNGNLSTKAMLVDLSIRQWNARKFDKKITQEVARRHGTTVKAGRYNKNLFPFEAPSYEAIGAVAGKARGEHYEQTLSWADDGPRILPAANYFNYMGKSRARRREFELAVAVFLPDYPTVHAKAKSILNSMYNAEDFPSQADMTERFEFSVKVLPLPSGEHFPDALANFLGGDINAVREDVNSSVQQIIADTVGELWQRLYKAVAHFHEQVKGGVVKDALIVNLRELCEILPRLNLTGDARLDEMQRRIMEKLSGYDAEDLKKGKKRNRRQAAAEAEQIVKDLSAYMGS